MAPVRDLVGIDLLILQLNRAIARRVELVLRDPEYKRLEAAWRSILWLCRQVPASDPAKPTVQILLFPASIAELARDLRSSGGVERSKLYRELYSQGLGQLGGTPIGMIVVDIEFGPDSHPGVKVSDIELLDRLAAIAAATFAPLVAGVSPAIFSRSDRFDQLQSLTPVRNAFETPQLAVWRSFRKSERSRFVALTAPRFLLRMPTLHDDSRRSTIWYRAPRDRLPSDDGVWGNGAFVLAAAAARSFHRTGWFAQICGLERDEDGRVHGGGIVRTPAACWRTDSHGVAWRPTTDGVFFEEIERAIAANGIIPIVWCKGTPLTAIFECPTFHLAERFESAESTANAWVGAQLPQFLCACRFAQLLKQRGHDSLQRRSAPVVVRELQEFLAKFTGEPSTAAYPLLSFEVGAIETAEGEFDLQVSLQPQYQFDVVSPRIVLRGAL